MSITTSFRLSISLIVLALVGLVVVLARAEPGSSPAVSERAGPAVRCSIDGMEFPPRADGWCYTEDAPNHQPVMTWRLVGVETVLHWYDLCLLSGISAVFGFSAGRIFTR